jgi:hypothetical protein
MLNVFKTVVLLAVFIALGEILVRIAFLGAVLSTTAFLVFCCFLAWIARGLLWRS